MKRVTVLVMFMIIGIVTISAQNTKSKINVEGTWKFEAPYAPEGYTSGTIVVGKADQKPTTTMSFTGSDYKMSGEKVVVENDTVKFSVYLEGQDIKVSLKIENATKMTGKAVYSEGEVPLTLTRSDDQVKK
jgi:hypothetical protein